MKTVEITKEILIDYCKNPLSVYSRCLYAHITGDLDFCALYPSIIRGYGCRCDDLVDFVTHIRSEYISSFFAPIEIDKSILDRIDVIINKMKNGEIPPVIPIESVEITYKHMKNKSMED